MMTLMLFLSACCQGLDAEKEAHRYIRNDGGDPDKAVCGWESDDGYECNYFNGRGKKMEIECSGCFGCRVDD